MSQSVGVSLPQFGKGVPLPPDELGAYVGRAEELGFDAVWLGEGLLRPAPSLEPLATLAFAAARTTALRLGVATLTLPLHDPVRLAKAVATIDWLSGGRLDLAVSVGVKDGPHAALGVRSGERRARMEEYVAIMRALWDGEVVDYAGEFRVLEGISVEPKPVQTPFPLLFGGSAPVALERAARLGDGWIGSGTSTVAVFSRQLEQLREALAEAGRDPASFAIGKRAFVAVDRTEADVTSWFGNTYGSALSSFPDAGVDPTASDYVAIGDVSEVTERLLAVRAAGADVLNIHPIGGEERAQMEAIAEHVLPQLRDG